MSVTVRTGQRSALDPAQSGRMAAIGAVVVVIAVATGLAAAAGSGAIAPTLLDDPGVLVRWGLVVVRVLADLSASVTIGVLLLAAIALPSKDGDAHRPALLIAATSATIWAVSQIVLLVFSFADVLGAPLGGPDMGTQLVAFARDVEIGRNLFITAVSAAVIGLLAAGATRLTSAGLLALAALATLVPTALSGHASTSTDHETAVTSLGVHLLGASIWAGGLAALLILAPMLSTSTLAAAVRRYSAFAVWCFAGVAISGLINAWLRVGSLSGLNSTYGLLLFGKAAALVILGGAGYWHRERTMPELDGGRRAAFARLAVVELGVMAVAFGLAAALSRTPPPNSGAPVAESVVQSLTGYALPGPQTLSTWLTAWHPDLLWILVAALAAYGYLAGVVRLRRRGDSWSPLRTVPFIAGLLVLTYTTSGAPAVYGRVLFSSHMVMHMLLTMVVPPLLVLGAPVTLALRTVAGRRDGSRGPREWILLLVESRLLKVLAFPPVAAVLFAGSLVVFYYSGLFHQALTTHIGHELMDVHFILTGYLFAWVLIGIDPGPQRVAYPFRLIVLLATMVFHAFFFLALMNGNSLLVPQFFGELGRHWGRGLLADQQFGGGIGWGIGEIPTLLIALVLVSQWSSSDDRDARRYDRAADRDGDSELLAYNEMLAKLAKRGG
jgi:cytochrome c oxidase assembly factor CtaG/putative copper export protein